MSSMHMETREQKRSLESVDFLKGPWKLPFPHGGAVPLTPLLKFCKFGLNFDQKVGSTGDCFLTTFCCRASHTNIH
ncbi:hypothetical protein V6N12_044496 [Hibiscus sabdariffa]|uniref:Uncharacterized protein n=1 Tax=Hibiscus sabdariffa TaxID=183260 RepID=A0ABR2BNA2_9ROSI